MSSSPSGMNGENKRNVSGCGQEVVKSNCSQKFMVPPHQQHPQRRRSSHGKAEQEDESNLLVYMQQACFENYKTFAYTLIIGSYFIAFCLYLYLRLISWIFPKKIIYKRHCQKHENETIVRMELHYASATATFLVMAIFQLMCFFFLTISSKWLEVRRSFTNFISMEERLRNELVCAIKRVMFVTVLPTFLVYSLSAIVVTLAIFYMVGMRDPVNHIGSQVIIYFFDGCMFVYFAAFPLICVMYHPDIRLLARCTRKRKLQSTPRRSMPSFSTNSPCATAPLSTVGNQQQVQAKQQTSQTESSSHTPQEAQLPCSTFGGRVTTTSAKQQQSCSSSTTSGRSLQQWAKQLPLNPTNLQHHPRLRVDNTSITTKYKYRRLSDEIRQTTVLPINEKKQTENNEVAATDDVVIQLGEGSRRSSSVNKKK